MPSFGRIAYQCYYRPLGAWKRMVAEGGPIEQWKTARGRREMEAAARRLHAIGIRHEAEGQRAEDKGPRSEVRSRRSEGSDLRSERRSPISGLPIEVHALTGGGFWYQTAFCLWTLASTSGRRVVPVIHDDGSLEPWQAEKLARTFPDARVEWARDAEARLDALLPESRYPFLRRRRRELPLIKKITDIHVGRSGWTLFMDADLLFFRRPDFLLAWWDAPRMPLTSVDVSYAYGYPLEMLEELAGVPVQPLINTGLSGHRSDLYDWDRMEFWCKSLIKRAGTHYYQEQALVALHLAGRECAVLPPEDYVTFPRPPEAEECRAVMHHYVAGSKPWYFRHNWRRLQTWER